MDCSMPGSPVLHHLPEMAHIHVHWVNDAIQPSHPLLPASPPAFNLSQHQGLFKWVSSIEKPTIQAEHLQVSMKAGTLLPHCSVYHFIPHLLQNGDTVGFTCVHVSLNIRHPKVEWSTWELEWYSFIAFPTLSLHARKVTTLQRFVFGIKLHPGTVLIRIDKLPCLLLFILKMLPH